METIWYYVAIFAAVLYLAVYGFYLFKDSNPQTRDMESGAESKLNPVHLSNSLYRDRRLIHN